MLTGCMLHTNAHTLPLTRANATPCLCAGPATLTVATEHATDNPALADPLARAVARPDHVPDEGPDTKAVVRTHPYADPAADPCPNKRAQL